MIQRCVQKLPDGVPEETSWKIVAPGRQTRKLTYPCGLVIQEFEATCGDCGEPDPRIFFVANPLWGQHGNGQGILCLRCFEKRLGRPLVATDLARIPANKLALQIAGIPLTGEES